MFIALAGMSSIEKIVVFGVIGLIIYGAFMNKGGKGGKNSGGGSSSSSGGSGAA